MKVWIVQGYDYDCSYIHGVYATQELADRVELNLYMQQSDEEYEGNWSYSVKEMEVEE